MRKLLLAVAIIAVAVWGATFAFQAERLRPAVRAALEQALQRRVEINGAVRYRWFSPGSTGPAISVADVVIHDDPKLSPEPVAYVTTLDASPRWLPILTGRIEFSRLTLNSPSVNLTRTSQGRLNVRPFLAGLASARDSGSALPEIRVRSGRLNFKQDVRKGTIYLTALDLDLRPTESSGFNISLTTEAARTDRPPIGFGSFSGQGRLTLLPEREPELDLTLDLDRSPLADVLMLIDGQRSEIGGRVSARVHLTGAVSKLKLDGRMDLEGFQRWNLPGFKPGALTLFYRGEADLIRPAVLLETAPGSRSGVPLKVRFRLSESYSRPRWGLVAAADRIPLNLLAEVARAVGFRSTDDATAEGTASGALGISGSLPGPQGGFIFEGEGFSGEYRYARGEDQPHRVTLECSQLEADQFRLRGARLRLRGTAENWTGVVDGRGGRGMVEVVPPRNEIRLSMSDGKQWEGQVWPLQLRLAKSR
jgi:hypothetical protein